MEHNLSEIVNSKNVRYEVALEILGKSIAPIVQALHDERKKDKPSDALIGYCKARIAAIDELQDSLLTTDEETIDRILANDPIFKVQ